MTRARGASTPTSTTSVSTPRAISPGKRPVAQGLRVRPGDAAVQRLAKRNGHAAGEDRKASPAPAGAHAARLWKNQKRAKKMTQFIEGQFSNSKIFEKHAPMIVRDALIFGRGILRVGTLGDKVNAERIHPWELFVDEWDARYGEPRNIYLCRSMDKGVVLNAFGRTDSGSIRPSIRDALDKAGKFNLATNYEQEVTSTVERVDVLEAWHLPSRPGAKDGRHVVVVQGATLLDESWDYDYFPFAILSYSDAVVGYWGHGLIEQLEGYAYEINCASRSSRSKCA